MAQRGQRGESVQQSRGRRWRECRGQCWIWGFRDGTMGGGIGASSTIHWKRLSLLTRRWERVILCA